MFSFFKEFNNREIAIAIWISTLLLFTLFGKKVRHSTFSLLKSFFSIKFQSVFLSLCFYVFGIICLLSIIKFWNYSLLKDTVFWFFGIAFSLIFRITNKVDIGLFRKTVKDSWKLTILIEFISTLYVFSLPLELILTLVLIFLSMMKPLAERDVKYKDARGFISKSIIILSAIVILFAFYKTIQHYKEFVSWSNMQSVLLSPILTMLYMPFLYILAVIFQYKILFDSLEFKLHEDKALHRSFKSQVFRTAKLNLTKINYISSKILKTDLQKIKNIPQYLRAISKSK